MRNASLAASRLHSDSILSSDLTINHSLLTIPETPNTGKTFLDDSDISHPPSSTKRNRMCVLIALSTLKFSPTWLEVFTIASAAK